MRSKLLACAATLIGGAMFTLASAPAHAQQDCPRGSLDTLYCDADKDLVADQPTDPLLEDDDGLGDLHLGEGLALGAAPERVQRWVFARLARRAALLPEVEA